MTHQPHDDVQRYIAEYSNHTDQCVARYPVHSFDLIQFQDEFGIVSPTNQMLDRYPVFESSVCFLASHLKKNIPWNFLTHSYYLESDKPHSI